MPRQCRRQRILSRRDSTIVARHEVPGGWNLQKFSSGIFAPKGLEHSAQALRAWLLSCYPSGTKTISFCGLVLKLNTPNVA